MRNLLPVRAIIIGAVVGLVAVVLLTSFLALTRPPTPEETLREIFKVIKPF